MTSISQQREIIDRLSLTEQLNSALGGSNYDASMRKKLVSILKVALLNGKAEIQRRFETSEKKFRVGVGAIRENSFLVDQLVRVTFDFATQFAYPVANKSTSEQLCLVAVGGYGRGELAPFSDVDLMFIIPYKETPYSEQVIEFILYMLWDVGLKVGPFNALS